MPKHPPRPHLYAHKINGETMRVIRASSVAEAREFARSLQAEEFMQLTTHHSFALAAMGVPMLDAKPEYALLDDLVQSELFAGDDLVDAEFDGDHPDCDEVGSIGPVYIAPIVAE